MKAKSAKVNTRKVGAELQKLYIDYSKKSAKVQELDDIVSPGVKSNDSAYASNRGNPTKKKQVETPAFGKQKTTFFKDTQKNTSPVKEVRDFTAAMHLKDVRDPSKNAKKNPSN